MLHSIPYYKYEDPIMRLENELICISMKNNNIEVLQENKKKLNVIFNNLVGLQHALTKDKELTQSTKKVIKKL